MASSSNEGLDESVPELIYQCLSILDENSCKRENLFMKCPLCHYLGKIFYCVDCVRNGDFTHSKKKCFERFADKKPKKYELDTEKADILQRYEKTFSKRKKVENMKLDIYKRKEKIQLLEESIKSCRDQMHQAERRIETLLEKKAKSAANESYYTDKLHRMSQSQHVQNEELMKRDKSLSSVNCAFQRVVKHRTNELIAHIFPITIVAPRYFKSCNVVGDDSQCAELEEARKTTYVQGQWVIAGSSADEMEYTVVEPRIPANGDYSAYVAWCSEHIQGISRDSLGQVVRYQMDVAYGISAALAYTAQLVGILAFYMDAHLPKRTSFSDFCSHEPSLVRFLHKVAKLNTNVVGLCLSQQVNISRINVHRTITNLLLFLQPHLIDVGRLPPFEDQEEVMESIEESLCKDMLTDESDSDEAEAEFVHVSEDEELLAVPEQIPCEPTPVQPPPSLVSSVFSLWKAATGQK